MGMPMTHRVEGLFVPLWLAASEADLLFMFVQQTADLSEVESERVDIVTFAPGHYFYGFIHTNQTIHNESVGGSAVMQLCKIKMIGSSCYY